MIELLPIFLKEDVNILRILLKIILLLNSVIYVTFYTCSNQNIIYHYHVLFYKFYKVSTSNYLVLMIFILFSSNKLLLDVYVHLKFSRISYLHVLH